MWVRSLFSAQRPYLQVEVRREEVLTDTLQQVRARCVCTRYVFVHVFVLSVRTCMSLRMLLLPALTHDMARSNCLSCP